MGIIFSVESPRRGEDRPEALKILDGGFGETPEDLSTIVSTGRAARQCRQCRLEWLCACVAGSTASHRQQEYS